MRVLYLTQWFDPEPIMKGIEFAKGLESKGFSIRVATGLPNYPLGRVYPGYSRKLFQTEVMSGINVDRLPLYASHDRSAFRRSLNYSSFFLSAFLYCLSKGRDFDVVYVYHPPITVGLAAALAGVVTRTPFVLDVQDLWPESVTASGMGGGGRAARLVSALCNFTYRRAAKVIVQSNGMRNALADRDVETEKIAVVFNWAADEDQPADPIDLTTYKLEDRFNIIVAGNIGVAQDLAVLIKAARIASKIEPRLQLIIIGSGVESEALSASLVIGDPVQIRNALPQAEVKFLLAACDVLALHLKDLPLYRVTIPSKTQAYLAAGKPILAAINGETAAIVGQLAAGRCAPAGDVQGIAKVMVEMARLPASVLEDMGKNSREGYRRQFSFSSAIDVTASLLGALHVKRTLEPSQ